MRGKKRDSEFVSEFIADCIATGKDTPEAILTHAKGLVNQYTQEIQQAETLKQRRAKMLDVIAAFEEPSKSSKEPVAKILSFTKINRPSLCSVICMALKFNNITVDELLGTYFSGQPEQIISDVMFALKQLQEHKVIAKLDNLLLRGELFTDYLAFSTGGAYVRPVH